MAGATWAGHERGRARSWPAARRTTRASTRRSTSSIFDLGRFRDLRKSDDDYGFLLEVRRGREAEPVEAAHHAPPRGAELRHPRPLLVRHPRQPEPDVRAIDGRRVRVAHPLPDERQRLVVAHRLPRRRPPRREPGPLLQRGAGQDREVPPLRPARPGLARPARDQLAAKPKPPRGTAPPEPEPVTDDAYGRPTALATGPTASLIPATPTATATARPTPSARSAPFSDPAPPAGDGLSSFSSFEGANFAPETDADREAARARDREDGSLVEVPARIEVLNDGHLPRNSTGESAHSGPAPPGRLIQLTSSIQRWLCNLQSGTIKADATRSRTPR